MAKARLEAVLDCNNKPFITSMNAGVKYANTSASKMKSAFTGIGSKMGSGLAGMLTAGAIAASARSITSYASEMKDLSDSIGMGTDEFQRYTFAMEQSGAGQRDLVKGMGSLISKIEDAKDGNKETIKQFQRLGVSMSDIHRKSPDQILMLIADELQRTGANGKTTSDVMDVLGTKVALKLIPALKGGSEAFLQLGADAKIMSKEVIDAVDETDEKFNNMVKGWRSKLAAQVVGIKDAVTPDKPITVSPMSRADVLRAGGREPGPEDGVHMMDEIVVEATKPRRPGFWQTDRPTMTKPTGQESKAMFGPIAEMNGGKLGAAKRQPFGGFTSNYFPGNSGGLTSSGLTSGGLSSSGLGGSGSAYGRVRAGDAARARDAKKGKDPLEAAAKATAANTAALAKAWGVEGVTTQ